MVAGDVVNGIGAVNTAFGIQPAVGIDLCLTQALVYTHWTDLTDGVNPQPIFQWHTSASNNSIPTKIMINNTNYIVMRADASYGGVYTGIQIK
tara:strand:- start:115 stop:393 length:279 start_codon:yes stop_codon:yes gene_type:complete